MFFVISYEDQRANPVVQEVTGGWVTAQSTGCGYCENLNWFYMRKKTSFCC